MQVRVLLQVFGLEVVAPEDLELLLADLRVLFLHRDHAHEVAARGEVGRGFVERADLLDHLRDGVGRDLRGCRIVDAAGDVAVRVYDDGRLEETIEHIELLRG